MKKIEVIISQKSVLPKLNKKLLKAKYTQHSIRFGTRKATRISFILSRRVRQTNINSQNGHLY